MNVSDTRDCAFEAFITNLGKYNEGFLVGEYFLLKPHFGTETVSWMCILGAAPFAALGFITYHGMTAEQFLRAWLRSELLEPKKLRFEASNLYYEALKDKLEGGKS